MHTNTEGCSPSLRAQLGVGWNRALPAPFSFGSGVRLDGSNDYFKAFGSALIGQSIATLGGTVFFEFWVKTTAAGTGATTFFEVADTVNSTAFSLRHSNSGVGSWTLGNFTSGQFVAFTDVDVVAFNGNPIHVFISYNASTLILTCTINRVRPYQATMLSGPQIFSQLTIGSRNGSGPLAPAASQIFDEFRVYKSTPSSGILGTGDLNLNYNGGLGNNPSKTENLLAWWQFTEGIAPAILYPGGIPGGWTAGAYGIKDSSPNGVNLMQLNMTNNATLGGVLQAF